MNRKPVRATASVGLAMLGRLSLAVWRELRAELGLVDHCCWCASTTSAGPLCPSCRTALPWNSGACRSCGQPIAGRPLQGQCGACFGRRRPFSSTVAPLRYEGMVIPWIHRLKEKTGLREAALFAGLIAEQAQAGTPAVPLPDCLVPVPLATGRLQRRGYNQATLLARPLGRRLGLPVLDIARRVRGTPSQRTLSRSNRVRNLRGAFTVRKHFATRLAGRRVAVVDDVMTTGATVAALARCLKRAGADAVDVWVAARA